MSRKSGGIAAVAALTLGYLSYVFQIFERPFWTAGIADWIDPYFLNWLMEHWHRALMTFSSPFSPPMFFPETRTLGRGGQGMVLFVPFYEVVRPFLHPFVAYNATLLLVMAAGTIVLFLLLRRVATLTNVEALALTMLFLTSKNIINGFTETWSQRASVFLVPPIVLLVLVSKSRLPAFLGGLTVGLLFLHDFYTAAFTVLIPIAFIPFMRIRSLHRRWWKAFGAGLIAGLALFVWVYWPAYRQQPDFPREQLLREIRDLDRGLRAFETLRPFILTAIVATFAMFVTDRKIKSLALWFVFLSVVVLLIPYRVGGFSIWLSFFARLPGSGAIRDPRRVVYLYELAVAMVTAVLMSRFPARMRVAVTMVIVALIATTWNRYTFNYRRPVETFDYWVSRPIAIDRSCRSFFIAEASTAYSSRSWHQWTLYGVDSMFIAIKYRLPTLNGYTGVTPDEWDMPNPYEKDYFEKADRWIAKNRLTNVCVLDIEPRTIRPYR